LADDCLCGFVARIHMDVRDDSQSGSSSSSSTWNVSAMQSGQQVTFPAANL